MDRGLFTELKIHWQEYKHGIRIFLQIKKWTKAHASTMRLQGIREAVEDRVITTRSKIEQLKGMMKVLQAQNSLM